MHIKRRPRRRRRLARVQMSSDSLRLLFRLSRAALDATTTVQVDPSAYIHVYMYTTHSTAQHSTGDPPCCTAGRQAAAPPVFYEPCPPEEDESSHITAAAARQQLEPEL
jgi:hypothetical protein